MKLSNEFLERVPRYKSHKVVQAIKILSIDELHASPGHPFRLAFEYPPGGTDGPLEDVDVTKQWLDEKKAHAGGYLVIYDDGYTSFSPAGPFDAGYERIVQNG